MPSLGEKRRTRLFQVYSNNLAVWYPELKGKYVCPLCIDRAYTIEAVKGPNPLLTDEHSIQSGLGSPCHILTCAECNNSAGARIDAHLHKRMEWEGFGRGLHQRPLNLRIEVGGDKLGVDVTRTAGSKPTMAIKIIEGQSDPKAIERVMEKMKAGAIEEMRMHFGRNVLPSIGKAKVATLKSAYLLAFRHFGYGYIISEPLDPVRKTINDPDNPVVPINDIIVQVAIEQLPHSIGLITTPPELLSYGVPIAYPKYKRAYVVALPNNVSTYERWKSYRELHGKADVVSTRLTPIPFDPSLLNERVFQWFPDEETRTTEEN